MPANMKFSLRFVRPAAAFSKSGATDDVATIKPMEGGQFRPAQSWNVTDGVSSDDTPRFTLDYLYRNAGQRIRTKQTLRASDVFRWLRNTLGLLRLDSDPFATIQLDMTGFPITLIDVKEIGRDRVYHAVLDALEFFLAQTPTEVPSTLSDARFTAYLNRRDHKAAPDFFKIQATPAADQFVLTYNDPDEGKPSVQTLSRKDTEEWARILGELLAVDGDPFESLQLSVSGFPDSLLRVSEADGEENIRRFFDAAAERFQDTLNFFLNTVERPAGDFIPVQPLEAASASYLSSTRYFEQDAQSVPIEEDTESEAESTDSEEEDSLESEEYSTDSEEEYADMPPLIPAGAACYGCGADHYQPLKQKHLFFDEDGDVIMGY
jgi:hypothetical protein